MFISAAPALGATNLAELIALAKKRPGEIAYGTNGPGRLTHLTGELLQARTGIKLLMVPYSGGTAQVLNDVMGGRIALVMDAYSGVAGAIQAGTVKPLAVASGQRMPNFPDLPTAAETIPGFAASGWQALVAPVGTPESIVHKISDDLRAVLSEGATKQRFEDIASYIHPMSPAELLACIRTEQALWKPVIEQISTFKPAK